MQHEQLSWTNPNKFYISTRFQEKDQHISHCKIRNRIILYSGEKNLFFKKKDI